MTARLERRKQLIKLQLLALDKTVSCALGGRQDSLIVEKSEGWRGGGSEIGLTPNFPLQT